ncbi:MAG: hemin uptake protein HemP [Pirellulaceae bacterium]|nr:hemin uptake protein HemP [Pirellulaceae bacterium]
MPGPASQPPEAGQAVSFELLGKGQNEVLIAYRGQLYRLRATRNGKLILNK